MRLSACLSSLIFCPDTSETNAVFCPRDWDTFQRSCYILSKIKKTWKNAQEICQRIKGATLVSLDAKEEEEYVNSTMKSKNKNKFHTSTRTSFSSSRHAFMCEYKLGETKHACNFLILQRKFTIVGSSQQCHGLEVSFRSYRIEQFSHQP